tara:strand:+ start:2785 stop:3483 length:699 start_codon:yes stop_codon:yes gene_type:complete
MLISKKKIIIITIIIIIFLWTLYFLNKDFFQLDTLFLNIEVIKNFQSENYVLSIFIYLSLYSILILCNFPMASLLSMISGFLFGTWIGGAIAILGGTIGAYCIFNIAKFFFLDFIKKNLLNKYTYVKNYFNKNDLELMILIRVIPAVPFFAQNLILAGMGANNKKFLYTTLFGLMPWSFIFASLGNMLEEIYLNNEKIGFSLIARPEFLIPIAIIVSLIILIIIFKKKFQTN